jgi:hypothetical protein
LNKILGLYLQALLLNGKKVSFSASVAFAENANAMNVRITLVKVDKMKDFLHDASYPAQFTQFLEKQGNVYVYMMELNGFAHIFTLTNSIICKDPPITMIGSPIGAEVRKIWSA